MADHAPRIEIKNVGRLTTYTFQKCWEVIA